MIIQLGKLLITNTHSGAVWVSLMNRGTTAGILSAGGLLLTALDDSRRLWISDQQGEGGEFSPEALADFIVERIALPGTDGALTVEVAGSDFDALVKDFYVREF